MPSDERRRAAWKRRESSEGKICSSREHRSHPVRDYIAKAMILLWLVVFAFVPNAV